MREITKTVIEAIRKFRIVAGDLEHTNAVELWELVDTLVESLQGDMPDCVSDDGCDAKASLVKEDTEDTGVTKLRVDLTADFVAVYVPGMGVCGMAPGFGFPVAVEYYDDGEDAKWQMVVWADINREEYTHLIDLSGAAEALRWEPDACTCGAISLRDCMCQPGGGSYVDLTWEEQNVACDLCGTIHPHDVACTDFDLAEAQKEDKE
jgi:hypothetical protein